MYDVATNLHKVKDGLPDGVRLIAISKFHPNEYIEAAYNEGQRVFGESHEQELSAKAKTLPTDIEWHFIGHLQTNKVKYIAPYISMIEAVDSMKLLKEINKQAAKHDRAYIGLDDDGIEHRRYRTNQERNDPSCRFLRRSESKVLCRRPRI